MTYLDLVLAGLLRGLSTVLPVDALSALGTALGFSASGAPPDPAVQSVLASAAAVGTAAAIVIALFSDIALLGRGLWKALKRRPDHASRLLMMIILASLPSLMILAVPDGFAPHWTPLGRAAAVVVLGLLLGAADHLGVTVRDMEHLTAGHYTIIGVIRAVLAFSGLVPQDGIIVLSRLFGCERDQAARLSLLLLILPLLAQAVVSAHAAAFSTVHAPLFDMVLVGVCALVASLAAVAFLLSWLKRRGFMLFALAHLALAAWMLVGVFWR